MKSFAMCMDDDDEEEENEMGNMRASMTPNSNRMSIFSKVKMEME
jgi:hypothetical protein